MDQKTQQGFPPPAKPLTAEQTPAWECVTPAEPASVRAAARRASENPLPCAASVSKDGREFESPVSSDRRESESPVSSDRREFESPVSSDRREFESPVSSDRREFDTVPGGGLNRESGGRPFARAYVSPKTPMPLTPGRYETVSVDVEPTVDQESRAHRTEPSLRRASTVPPPPPHESILPVSSRRLMPRPWLIGALSVSAGIGILIPLVSQNIAPEAPSGAAVAASLPVASAPSARPLFVPGPPPEAKVLEKAAEPAERKPLSEPSVEKKEVAPISSNSAAVRPKKPMTLGGKGTESAPSPGKKKTESAGDLWLE